MPGAYLSQGITGIRDAVAAKHTHVGLSTDTTPFSAGQTTLSPGGGTEIIKPATVENVSSTTTDHKVTVTGGAGNDGVGAFSTVGVLEGAAASTAASRSVRTYSIGVDEGDVVTVAVRQVHSDTAA